jgi:hypothetical protein
MSQCTAKSKRSHERCRHAAMHGRTTCYHHGGTTPTGYGLPQTTHGRYSKVLPIALARTYQQARANQDLLSLRDDIAVAEARLGELFGHLSTGESSGGWQALCTALDTFSAALAVKDGATMHAQLQIMRQLATHGREDATAWRDIQVLWESRCRLTLTEHKTLLTSQQMVSTEKLMVMFGVITDVIKQTVSTYAEPASARNILAALSAEFGRIGLSESGAEA